MLLKCKENYLYNIVNNTKINIDKILASYKYKESGLNFNINLESIKRQKDKLKLIELANYKRKNIDTTITNILEVIINCYIDYKKILNK